MKKIGIHTPKKSEEYFYTIIGGTNLNFEDTSWKNDLCDSIGNEKYYIMFPNSNNDNPGNEEFNKFILSSEYGEIQNPYLVTKNILEIIKYINKNK
jgi:hypothetical protein